MFKSIFLLISLILSLNLSADSIDNKVQYNQKAHIILNTIDTLETSGYITKKNSLDAKKELVFNDKSLILIKKNLKETTTVDKLEINFLEYFSLINIIKIIAVISFLFAFNGLILKFIFLFKKIPKYVYQIIFMSISLGLTLYGQEISISEAFYIKNFAVISNLIIILWIISSYEEFFMKLFKYISFNLPEFIVVFFYLTLYFGGMTIYLDSSFLGILTMVSFVSLLGFSISTSGLITYIGYDDEDFINISMIVNGIILTVYSFIVIKEFNIPYLDVFSIGIEYVLTIAFVVALLINSSFINKKEPFFAISVTLFIISFILSVISSILFNLEVIPAIINTGFFIFVLSWIGYLSSKIGGIFMFFVIGVSLYASALFIESKPEYFITALF